MIKRSISTRGILEKIVTLYVDDTTKAFLDAQTNTNNGQVQIPAEGYAVTLNADETVGFGSSATGVEKDALFGMIKTYSGANTVGVQIEGFVVKAPAKAAIALNANTLVATSEGTIASVAAVTNSRGVVTKAATATDLTVNFYLG